LGRNGPGELVFPIAMGTACSVLVALPAAVEIEVDGDASLLGVAARRRGAGRGRILGKVYPDCQFPAAGLPRQFFGRGRNVGAMFQRADGPQVMPSSLRALTTRSMLPWIASPVRQ
jgi:hypothetical protein